VVKKFSEYEQKLSGAGGMVQVPVRSEIAKRKGIDPTSKVTMIERKDFLVVIPPGKSRRSVIKAINEIESTMGRIQAEESQETESMKKPIQKMQLAAAAGKMNLDYKEPEPVKKSQAVFSPEAEANRDAWEYLKTRENEPVKVGINSEDSRDIKQAFIEISKLYPEIKLPDIHPNNLKAIQSFLNEYIGDLSGELKEKMIIIINAEGYGE